FCSVTHPDARARGRTRRRDPAVASAHPAPDHGRHGQVLTGGERGRRDFVEARERRPGAPGLPGETLEGGSQRSTLDLGVEREDVDARPERVHEGSGKVVSAAWPEPSWTRSGRAST